MRPAKEDTMWTSESGEAVTDDQIAEDIAMKNQNDRRFVNKCRMAIVNINNKAEWELADMAVQANSIMSVHDFAKENEYPTHITEDDYQALRRFLVQVAQRLGDASYLYAGR